MTPADLMQQAAGVLNQIQRSNSNIPFTWSIVGFRLLSITSVSPRHQDEKHLHQLTRLDNWFINNKLIDNKFTSRGEKVTKSTFDFSTVLSNI